MFFAERQVNAQRHEARKPDVVSFAGSNIEKVAFVELFGLSATLPLRSFT
jgi:hypothetical protein